MPSLERIQTGMKNKNKQINSIMSAVERASEPVAAEELRVILVAGLLEAL